MYCKHCGKEIDSDSKFCQYCGKSLVEKKLKQCAYCQNMVPKLSKIGLCSDCQALYDTGEIVMITDEGNEIKSKKLQSNNNLNKKAKSPTAQLAKNVLVNISGVALGLIATIIACFIADFILVDLLANIPIIPQIISWPVSYNWYANTGTACAMVFTGSMVCNFICSFSKSKYNYGTLALCGTLAIFFLYVMINWFITEGFSLGVLIIYGFAILTAVFAGFSSFENDRS